MSLWIPREHGKVQLLIHGRLLGWDGFIPADTVTGAWQRLPNGSETTQA